MSIEIVSPADRTPKILLDLGKRRATILDVSGRGGGGGGGSTGDGNKVLSVLAPLAELSGYSSVLRVISSGTASMSMQPHGYARMSVAEELRAIRRAQGLE